MIFWTLGGFKGGFEDFQKFIHFGGEGKINRPTEFMCFAMILLQSLQPDCAYSLLLSTHSAQNSSNFKTNFFYFFSVLTSQAFSSSHHKETILPPCNVNLSETNFFHHPRLPRNRIFQVTASALPVKPPHSHVIPYDKMPPWFQHSEQSLQCRSVPEKP